MTVDVVIGAVAIEVPPVLLQSASDATSTGFQRHVQIYARLDRRVQNGGGVHLLQAPFLSEIRPRLRRCLNYQIDARRQQRQRRT